MSIKRCEVNVFFTSEEIESLLRQANGSKVTLAELIRQRSLSSQYRDLRPEVSMAYYRDRVKSLARAACEEAARKVS